MCDTCYMGYPSMYLSKTYKDNGQYEVRVMLAEVLEQRTGSQGWFTVSNDPRELDGRYCESNRTINGTNPRACQLWNHMLIKVRELHELDRVVHPIMGGPDFDDCPGWDSRTKQGLQGLCWTRLAEDYSTAKSGLFRDLRAEAREALSTTTEHTCSCGDSHEHEGIPVSLPTPADVRALVEDVVSKHLVNSLLAN